MALATPFERTVNVAEYHARRALAAGRTGDTRAQARHSRIMRDLIEGTDYPGIAEEALAMMVGRSRAAVLKLTQPVMVLA